MSARRHRIAHVITRLELGGAQQNTLYCTANHDRDRFEVALLAGSGGILDDEARRIPDAEVRLVPWLRHPVSPLADLSALLRLRSWLRRQRIDLVHTHSSKAGILGRWAAHLAGVRCVVHTVHGWSFNDTQPAPQRACYVALERAAARVTTRLVAVSRANRETGLALGIGRRDAYDVIHSGIDLAPSRGTTGDREALRRGLGFEPDQIVVGSLSCLKPQKAPLDFVRAAARAHAADARLRFFIAGDGEQREAVEALVHELGLDGVVRLLGWRRDVPELLGAMDLFLLTSRFEGLPRSVLQAMAAGVAVVATAVDGTPEAVRDGETGILVPPGDPELAAAAVLKLAADEGLRRRCAAAGRLAVSDRFEIGRMLRDLESIYLDLLSSR